MPEPALKTIHDLLDVMAALRTPGTGCPWDLAQTFATIAPYTIEEAYEVAEAITEADMPALKDELGDLLLQVVYHARMAEEARAFTFADVVDGITAKMIRRHPHVFGTPAERAAGAAPGFWERIKAEEKARRGMTHASGHVPDTGSALDGVPAVLPALTRAVKLQDKAARVGFDWPSLAPVFDKLKEELQELEAAVAARAPAGEATPTRVSTVVPGLVPGIQSSTGAGASGGMDPGDQRQDDVGGDAMKHTTQTTDATAAINEEFGDLLFVVANVARHLKLDPEAALRAANAKFARRFHRIEALLAAAGRTPAQSNLAEMDRLWDQAKAEERNVGKR